MNGCVVYSFTLTDQELLEWEELIDREIKEFLRKRELEDMRD